MLKIKIPSDKEFIINADFFNENAVFKPLIIFSHGFKGFKDWGGFPYLMQKLSKAGFACVSFNFSHNGVLEENPAEFTRLDLFAQNTFSRELHELERVIDHFYNNAADYNIDKTKFALIGHSRGGGISVLKAARDQRIKCLVTLSSVSSFDRYSEKLKENWKRTGFIESENTRTKQMMRLNYTLLQDLETNCLDIIEAIGSLKIPALIIHGREDLAVKVNEAEEIWNNSDKKLTELSIIENTGHTFGISHPFSGTTEAFEKVIVKTEKFLHKNL